MFNPMSAVTSKYYTLNIMNNRVYETFHFHEDINFYVNTINHEISNGLIESDMKLGVQK